MKNKFLLTIALATLSLGGCTAATGSAQTGSTNRFDILEYTYSYKRAEGQSLGSVVRNGKYDDVFTYLAHCKGDVFVEVPDDYYLTTIELEKTDKKYFYVVYTKELATTTVSNKGWEMKK